MELNSAFVLHRRPYSNTGLLVECFTADAGRFPAIARKGRSGAGNLLQPFTPLMIGWRGRGEVKSLASFEADGKIITLSGKALYCGFYVNELVMRLLARSDPHPGLYGYYRETLKDLAEGRLGPALRRFERLLLEEMGYGLVLDRDVEKDELIDPGGHYRYELERGPVPSLPGTSGSIPGRVLLALGENRPLDGGDAKSARELMRTVLGHYLGHRPLKSRELFRK